MSIMELLLIVNLLITVSLTLFVLFQKRPAGDKGNWQSDLAIFGAELNKVGPLLRGEMTRTRPADVS